MPKYSVVLETVSEQVIEVDADSESEAANLVTMGEGKLVDEVLTWPTIIATRELDEDVS
jgi:hypothetical protein